MPLTIRRAGATEDSRDGLVATIAKHVEEYPVVADPEPVGCVGVGQVDDIAREGIHMHADDGCVETVEVMS